MEPLTTQEALEDLGDCTVAVLADELVDAPSPGDQAIAVANRLAELHEAMQEIAGDLNELLQLVDNVGQRDLVANAHEVVMNTLLRLRDAAQANDVEDYEECIAEIKPGVRSALLGMHKATVGSAAFEPMLRIFLDDWNKKLQSDSAEFFYWGVQEFNNRIARCMAIWKRIERLGTMLVIMNLLSRYPREGETSFDPPPKAANAMEASNRRYGAWMYFIRIKTLSLPAYNALVKEICDQRNGLPPTYWSLAIRDKGVLGYDLQISEVEVGEPRQEWYLKSLDDGTWEIWGLGAGLSPVVMATPVTAPYVLQLSNQSTLGITQAKIIPAEVDDDEREVALCDGLPPPSRIRVLWPRREHNPSIEAMWALCRPPCTMSYATTFGDVLEWTSSSARGVAGAIINASKTYVLIPILLDNCQPGHNTFGDSAGYAYPCLPGEKMAMGGCSNEAIVGATAFFGFNVWDVPAFATAFTLQQREAIYFDSRHTFDGQARLQAHKATLICKLVVMFASNSWQPNSINAIELDANDDSFRADNLHNPPPIFTHNFDITGRSELGPWNHLRAEVDIDQMPHAQGVVTIWPKDLV